MGFEFKINEELAAITTTANELLSITRVITEIVNNKDFLDSFNWIIAQISKSYPVVLESFLPFLSLESEESFVQSFGSLHQVFKDSYLFNASKPRRYCDSVYDAYIQLQKTKEAKSRFPILKRSFNRMELLYDKWITNDALLAMSIDGVLKLQNRLLNEVAEIKSRDTEDAYLVFSAAFNDFADSLALIKRYYDSISAIIAPAPPVAATSS